MECAFAVSPGRLRKYRQRVVGGVVNLGIGRVDIVGAGDDLVANLPGDEEGRGHPVAELGRDLTDAGHRQPRGIDGDPLVRVPFARGPTEAAPGHQAQEIPPLRRLLFFLVLVRLVTGSPNPHEVNDGGTSAEPREATKAPSASSASM